MSPSETMVADRFKALLAQRLTVFRVILFGSRARGSADPASDMDVVVVLSGAVGDPERDYVSECAWDAGFDQGIVVVPIVFGRDEWESGPEKHSLLARAVAAEGVPL